MERVQIKYNSDIQYWDILHNSNIPDCIIDKVRLDLNNLDRGPLRWLNIIDNLTSLIKWQAVIDLVIDETSDGIIIISLLLGRA